MYCAYPAPQDEAYLKNIIELARQFSVCVGLSDHTLGNTTALTAVALGASIIEKHITLSRDDGGVDSAFSLEPKELKSLVDDINLVSNLIKGPNIGAKRSEKASLKFRRSLYAVADISVGENFTLDNVR